MRNGKEHDDDVRLFRQDMKGLLCESVCKPDAVCMCKPVLIHQGHRASVIMHT